MNKERYMAYGGITAVYIDSAGEVGFAGLISGLVVGLL